MLSKILKNNSQNTTQNDELITNGRLENRGKFKLAMMYPSF
jgi:hypothetical protein